MDEETNVEGGPNKTGLHWIAPLLILIVLILLGAWFCRTKPEPAKPETPKPATTNANAANTNAAPVSNTGTAAPSGNSNTNHY
jgi:hypothetical protein